MNLNQAWAPLERGAAGPDARRRRRRRLLALAAALAGAWMLLGGDQGLLSLAGSWKERWQLTRDIARLERENAELAARQAVLARDSAPHEKTAREKLMLKRPGELIYRFDKE